MKPPPLSLLNYSWLCLRGVSLVFVLCPPETEDGRGLLVGALVGESFMNFQTSFKSVSRLSQFSKWPIWYLGRNAVLSFHISCSQHLEKYNFLIWRASLLTSKQGMYNCLSFDSMKLLQPNMFHFGANTFIKLKLRHRDSTGGLAHALIGIFGRSPIKWMLNRSQIQPGENVHKWRAGLPANCLLFFFCS